ncbi:MAG: alpha-N-arabinofuranosidase [Planctomycetota bacterium]|jgi:alpha-N-arabinofuranosidase
MNKVVIHADRGEQTISRHIYGQFLEHTGRCVYGGAWVGLDSDIANSRGWRNDVIDALLKMEAPNMRWPGGNFAERYRWRDGVGPVEQRPVYPDEPNEVGTHEFMDLCGILDCEPYLCANLLTGSCRQAAEWQTYMTSDGDDELAALRRANGREEPWNVPFWVIGNEIMTTMTPEYFSSVFNLWTNYVSGECIIACGPNHENYDWTDTVMRLAGDRADALAMHYYTIAGPWADKGDTIGFSEDDWFQILKNALYTEELLVNHSAIMDRYDPDARVKIVIDEWGTWYNREEGAALTWQQNTLRDAVMAGVSLNIFNNHCRRVLMTNISQVANVLQAMILTDENNRRMLLTPTYHVFEMFTPHHDATLLPTEVTCESYEFDTDNIPALSVSASRDEAGKVHISLCNMHPNRAMDVACELRGVTTGAISGRILTAEAMDEHNTFDEPDRLTPTEFTGATLTDAKLSVALPGKSVVMLELT